MHIIHNLGITVPLRCQRIDMQQRVTHSLSKRDTHYKPCRDQ